MTTDNKTAALSPPAVEGITADRLDRHKITAGECPPQSEVVLLSSLKRMLAEAPAIAPGGDGKDAALRRAFYMVSPRNLTAAEYMEKVLALSALPAAANAGAVDDAWERMTYRGERLLVHPAIKSHVECALLAWSMQELAEQEAAALAPAAAKGGDDPVEWVAHDTLDPIRDANWHAAVSRGADPPAAGEWLPWSGGKCPVPHDSRVEFRMRDPDRAFTSPASELDWSHGEGLAPEAEIIAYRIAAAQEAARG